MSDSLWPHGLQHFRPRCPSPSPEVCPSSSPLNQWCHPAISPSDVLVSFSPQSFPASGTFPMSQLFVSDDQNTGASTSGSVFPTSIQGWFPLRLTGLISLLSKVFLKSSPAPQLEGIYSWCSAFFTVRLSQQYMDQWEEHSLDYTDLCQQSIYSLGLSQLSCQEAIVFWFHGCSHHPQWF